ncbi:PIN domain-containing protein [Kineococcus gypseus]|uniref:type II toxin-antitoxin system VapC family toxin n=1 Tax=Kineococcus gypseus TaxID=1637102 RepID=UPI003D7C3A17
MIVVDASAAVAALLTAGPARRVLSGEVLHVPHLVDHEVASVLRRQVAAGGITSAQGWTALDVWRHLGVSRHPAPALLDRVWELREDLTAYDATCVALAEALDCALLTADARISRAPGVRCPVTVVPG